MAQRVAVVWSGCYDLQAAEEQSYLSQTNMGDAGDEESMLLEVLDWEEDFFVSDEASVADPVAFPGTSLQVSTITSNNDDT